MLMHPYFLILYNIWEILVVFFAIYPHGTLLVATQSCSRLLFFDPCRRFRNSRILSWIQNLTILSILVESDSKIIVDAFQKSNPGPSIDDLVIDFCKLLSSNLVNCTFVYVFRSVNQTAHILIKTTNPTDKKNELCFFLLDL